MLTPMAAEQAKNLPPRRWFLMLCGTVICLSVYYLNYGSGFEEGEMAESTSGMSLLIRLLGVVTIVLALGPFRVRLDYPLLLLLLFLYALCSFLLTIGWAGGMNDVFFLNTVLQLPLLFALTSTVWRIPYAEWLRLIGIVLVLQIAADTYFWLSDSSLWLSKAFIGGMGNPSSFGLLCSMFLAFYLFHPEASSGRFLFVVVFAFAAVMTKALFAVLSVAILIGVWLTFTVKRFLIGILIALGLAVASVSLWSSSEGSDSFVMHKLNAMGALIGLVEYDVESSASVSQRVEMHEKTFSSIADEPMRLFTGHLRGQPYWPMDSQLLTYLGSFGLLMLLAFAALHAVWVIRAWRARKIDGGVSAWMLVLFALIFLTNRILDYFPVATFYFIAIAMSLDSWRVRREQAAVPA